MPFDPSLPFEEVDETDAIGFDTVNKPKATGFDFNQPFEEVEIAEDKPRFDADYFKPKPLKTEKKEQPEGESIFRQVADIPLGIARGGVTGIKMMTDILGADNPVSKSLSGVEGYMADLMSAQAKEDQQEISRIMKDAEDKGFGEQVKAGIKAFSIAPVDIMSQALGTMAPVLATGLAGSAAKIGALGIRGIQAGVGAGMGAGMIKGEIYNEVKNELINSGTPEEIAEKAAVDAQSYGGKNLDQILLGAGLGAASTLGAEGIITRILTKQGVAPTAGIVSRTLKGGITEAIPEGVQAAQEQLAKNVALQREGFDIDPSRGVVAAATMEAIAGAPLGGIAGAVEKPAPIKTLAEENFDQTNEIASKVAESGAPLTASALQDKAAVNLNQDALAKKLEEELSLTATKPAAAPPTAIPTKEDYVARYSAIAQTAPEELTRAEQAFTNELAAADTEEKRVNAQNALDAIKEVKTVGITPAAQPPVTPVTQPPITDATKEIIQPKGVRQEPQDGTQIGQTTEAGVSDSLLGAKGIQEEGQVDPIVVGLQAVANNTATREQIASLSLSGLVDVRRGQAIINEDGEGILAQAQAPLPTLTPEERAAEVEATPVTPRPLPTDVLPTETPGAEYGREAELFDVFGGVRRKPAVTEPTIGEIPQTSPMIGEQPAEPIISEIPKTSEIVGAEPTTIVEQEQVVPKETAVTTALEIPKVSPTEKAIDVARKTNFAAAPTREEAGSIGRAIASQDPTLPPAPPSQFETLQSISNFKSKKGYNPEVLTTAAIKEAKDNGWVVGKDLKNLKFTESGRAKLSEWNDQSKNRYLAEASLQDEIGDLAVSQWDAARKTTSTPNVIEPTATGTPVSGQPFEFFSIRNKEKAPQLGSQFGQDIEPSGKYVSQSTPSAAKNLDERFEKETVRFENPLVVEFGGEYGTPTNWKSVLSSQYGGKTGTQLSQAIRDAGYDGIVTVEPAKGPNRPASTSEIVDIRGIQPTTTTPVSPAPKVAPVTQVEQEIEVGDEAFVNLAGRNETVTIARIENINGVPTAYFDYFGYKSRPLSEMQLSKKSKQNIAKAKGKAKISQIEIEKPKPEDFFSNEEISSLASGKAPDGWKSNFKSRDEFPLTDKQGKRWTFEPQYINGKIASILMRAEGQYTGVTIEYTPAPVAETPVVTEALAAEPAGISVGNRIKLGKSPQTYTIEEIIPQTKAEVENDEQFYSVKNERTGEVQVVEARDLKPVKKMPIRKAIADAVPTPDDKLVPAKDIINAVIKMFGKDFVGEYLTLIDDVNEKAKAAYEISSGTIYINRAYLSTDDNIRDYIAHELGHYIAGDPTMTAKFQEFFDSLPAKDKAKLDRFVENVYNDETGEVRLEEKQVYAFIMRLNAGENRNAFQTLMDAIKKWLNKNFKTKFKMTDRDAAAILAGAVERFKSGEFIPREEGFGTRYAKAVGEPRREQVAGEERGDIITTPEGIIKQTNEVLRNKFFDGSVVSDENTGAAWNYIEQLLDIKSGAANALAGQINDVVDQETNSDSRMGASLFSVSLANYSAKLAAQGDNTMISYIIRRINRMPIDNLAGGASDIARALRGRREYEIDGYKTLETEHDSKVERTAAALFGSGKPSEEQVSAVDDAIKASEDTPIGEVEQVVSEVENVEKRTGRKVIKKIEDKIKESTEPKKEELLISFQNLNADKKIKGITLTYNPQKVNPVKSIQNFIIGKLVDYRKTLINQGASGLESTFWQTMSDQERKPGPLGEIDQAQNNELAKIVQKTLIDLGLRGEPPNTKMTDIEKVASILNKQKLSDEKRIEADKRIVSEIERRRESELASGSSPEAVNAKYDAILDAWNQSMSRQLNMPVSDNMLQRLINAELKEQNTKISNLIDEADGKVVAKTKQGIVDSIIRKIYGVSKESEAGIEMDENYDGLKSYLEQTLDNMYALQVEKKNAAYADRKAKISLRNNVEGQAQSIINQLADQLSDTPAFPEKQENQVKAIVQQDLRQRPDMKRKQPWTSQLTAKLMQAGVSEAQAETISNLVWRQHEIKAMDRELKELQMAAEKGSLAVIIQRIKDTPLEEQQKPEWMQEVIREYLIEAGLSSQAADTAARLYESVIAERFAEAKQKAFEATLAKSAPWNNYLSRNAQLGKNALKKIQDAIRTGVLDPTQTTEGIIAKENGWSGFSKEQLTRIVQLDGILSDDANNQVDKAEAMSELNKIIVKAKMPVRFKDAIGAYYVAQALMGIPTLLVNIVSPIGFSVRNMITDIGKYSLTEPSRIPMAFETFLDSMKSWYNQTSYAFKNQIYMNDVVEYLQGQNVLRELFDKGKDQWAKGDYANGMANMLVGMTQITGRVLSSLDQGAISALENQNISRYAMEAMKHNNIPKDKRKEFANMILHMRRQTYAEAVANGMKGDRAGVLADFAVRNEIVTGLAEMGVRDKVLDSAINDALQTVGRNKTIDIDRLTGTTKKLSDEGRLSYLPISFLENIASGAAKQGPAMQVFSKMLYGFALVPARVFHTTAWYSPYGFVRLAVDKYKKNKGEDSPYAMSLQTELQYKQRLTETIAGSVVMLGLAALAGSSTDDDEEKKFRIVITGNGPSYSADKQYYDAWHKKYKPYSFHIVMGDTIIPINIGRGGEALFFPIMLAGALDDWKIKEKLNLAKKEPKELNLAVETLGSAFFALAQRGPYSAFSKPLFDATQSGKITEELVGQAGFFGKTFVPIIGSSLSRNISDFVNDPVDRSSLQGAIYANTPIVGPWIGTKALNALGQPMRADDWGDKLFKLGVPVVFSFPKNTPENELNELILKKGSGPSIPTRSNAQKRFGDVLTDKEFETYVREYGRVVSDKMFKNRKKLEGMSVKNYDDELEGYVRGYSVGETKITGASDMAVRAVKRLRDE